MPSFNDFYKKLSKSNWNFDIFLFVALPQTCSAISSYERWTWIKSLKTFLYILDNTIYNNKMTTKYTKKVYAEVSWFPGLQNNLQTEMKTLPEWPGELPYKLFEELPDSSKASMKKNTESSVIVEVSDRKTVNYSCEISWKCFVHELWLIPLITYMYFCGETLDFLIYFHVLTLKPSLCELLAFLLGTFMF